MRHPANDCDGGTKPFWSADGRTLFFASADRLWAATIRITPELVVSRPVEVLELNADRLAEHGVGRVDIFGQETDGSFLAVTFPPVTTVTQLEAIFNFQP